MLQTCKLCFSARSKQQLLICRNAHSNTSLSSVPRAADFYNCALVCGIVKYQMMGPPGSPGFETGRGGRERQRKRHLTFNSVIAAN